MNKSILFSFLVVFLLGVSSCRNGFFKTVHGNGVATTDNRYVKDFHRLEVQGFMNVFLIQGDEYNVRLEGESNVLPFIETFVDEGRLVVRVKRNININTSRELNVYVTSKFFSDVSLSGSGDVVANTKLTNDHGITFSLSGSGTVTAEVDAPEVLTELAGSGKLKLRGETAKLKVDIAGSGDYESPELKSEDAKIAIAGSGNAHVYASMKLDVEIAGSGDVYYGMTTNPAISTSIVGSGSLKKED